ncbi:putative secreted protein (Por secretion system target) [Marinilabilia salmonicolor]|jgi:lysophospholipase L1-like esterase|uniref:GDSL-type esterase/lipase family protein n=1 Tax=Marinilabilia salmonicolor TaxID=989 RepID=UPI000D08262E|nr:GDSL-type esterase/lipase family protein [Marinilabilia salmonicolor]PRY99904.1 putative secreted protein (Por secretion system target) [Marinilabilia salmonicolor]
MKPKITIFLLLILLLTPASFGQDINRNEPLKFLALGDSYTIGQSVPESKRWPVQLANILQAQGIATGEVRIIAQTGWRTDNLINAISNTTLKSDYNLVSLLIGVNNQYQGGSISTYSEEFEELLQTAIELAGNDKSNVMVVSIPDYAYTPFGNGSANISREIDQFNAVNKDITQRYGVAYHNITPISRRGLSEPELVASDGLHPSGEQYKLWAEKIAEELNISDDTALEEHHIQYRVNITNSYLIFNTPEVMDLKIYEISGKLVLHQKDLVPSLNHEINLTGLKTGVYVLKLENNKMDSISEKFIVSEQ